MPVRPQKWLTEFRFNTGIETEGLVLPSFLSGHTVTGLTNGGYVTTWLEFDQTAGVLNLKAQVFNALGFRAGGEIAVNTNAFVGHEPNNANDAEIYDVAAQPGGGFVVTWARTVGNGDVVFQRFSSTGAKLGGEMNVAGGADADREFDPSIATLANGNFVITWTDDPAVPRVGNTDIHGSVYSQNGVLLANGRDLPLALSFTNSIGGFPTRGDVAALADGGFIVAFKTGSGDSDVRYHKWIEVSAGGGAPFFLETSSATVNLLQPTGEQTNPSIVGLSNGGWAVVYEDVRNSSDNDVFLRVYNSAGTVVNSVTLAETTSLEGHPSIAAGTDGTFLVTWDSWIATGVQADAFEVDVFAQLFTNAGAAIGAPVQVNTVETGDSALPSATALGDGRYLVGWLRDTGQFSANTHNFGQILDGRDALIRGNNLANSLVGHAAGATIQNDQIFALGGNDFLYGLGGNDLLDGGLGSDRMAGGIGNDTYIVDSAADIVVEAANEGTADTVRASATITLGANVEHLILSGIAAIGGTGNTLANIMLGNAGANAINGGGGNDLINGAGGNDILTGGLGNDTFLFASAIGAGNVERLTDFSAAFDTIKLENAVFTTLTQTGTLAAGAFFAGASAHDADDRIIYNRTTGALYYDSNGNGAGGAVWIASLSTKPIINNLDFVVV